MMSEQNKTLYERLGGYDAIAAAANDLLPRLHKDPQLGGFWAHRGEDGGAPQNLIRPKWLVVSMSWR